MAPDADATAGPPQGWHDLEAVLAEEPVARLLAAYLATRGRPCGATWPVAAWPDPSSRRRDLAPGGWCPAARTLDLSSLASSRRSSALGGEWGAVDEHAMQDNRELSCEG